MCWRLASPRDRTVRVAPRYDIVDVRQTGGGSSVGVRYVVVPFRPENLLLAKLCPKLYYNITFAQTGRGCQNCVTQPCDKLID